MDNEELKSNGQLTGEMSNKIKRTSSEGVFMSVSKKAEKLTTALYMLTDLIREDDPMRLKIRQTSISILSDTRGLSYAMTGDLYFHLARVISKSWEIVSLIEVCVVVGFISDMNYNILKNALIDFISDLRNRQKIEGFSHIQDLKIGVGESTNFKLKSDFFKISAEDLSEMKEQSIGQISDNSDAQKNKQATETIETPVVKIKNKIISKSPMSKESFARVNTFEASKSTRTQTSVPTAGQANRIEKIIELINEKKDISIKDIVSYFKEYSQKTIQRDLASLVEEGKVKRTGEKRWSRYSI